MTSLMSESHFCPPTVSSFDASTHSAPIPNEDEDHRWFFPRRPLERDQNLDEKLQIENRRMTESPGYQRTLPFRRKLPAFEKRSQVMKLIRSGNVCVISGSTGSGKTTQIPQFILDEALEKGESDISMTTACSWNLPDFPVYLCFNFWAAVPIRDKVT